MTRSLLNFKPIARFPITQAIYDPGTIKAWGSSRSQLVSDGLCGKSYIELRLNTQPER